MQHSEGTGSRLIVVPGAGVTDGRAQVWRLVSCRGGARNRPAPATLVRVTAEATLSVNEPVRAVEVVHRVPVLVVGGGRHSARSRALPAASRSEYNGQPTRAIFRSTPGAGEGLVVSVGQSSEPA
jgi:hypothetical protein